MSYLSCDMSLKVYADGSSKMVNQRSKTAHARGVKGFMQYLTREISVEAGYDHIYGYHETIDTARTHQNVTVYRCADGKYRNCRSADDLYESYQRRIEDVEVKRHLNGQTVTLRGTKALRKSSCVLRSIVVQADGHSDDKFYGAAVEEIADRVGWENVIGFSIHRDETSAHCHILVVPVSEGHLDQAKVLPHNGAEMRDFHASMRQSMHERYSDISLENKPDTYKNASGATVNLEKDERELHERNSRNRAKSKLLDKAIMQKEATLEQLNADIEQQETQRRVAMESIRRELEDEFEERVSVAVERRIQAMQKEQQNSSKRSITIQGDSFTL